MVDRKVRELSEEDILKIASTYQNWRHGKDYEDIQGFCKSAALEEVSDQDYILTPGRYVGIEEQEDDGEPFEEKMTRLTTDLYGLFEESRKLEDEICKKLATIGYSK
jgi:type I restriction enzyme M protein